MAIFIHENSIQSGLNRKRILKAWIKSVILNENRELGNINIIFLKDEDLRKINVDFLSRDYYTDIITFDYTVNDIINGDLYISIERVIENAGRFKVGKDEELLRVIIHGVLHLLGYKDSNTFQKKEMRSKEDASLREYFSSL